MPLQATEWVARLGQCIRVSRTQRGRLIAEQVQHGESLIQPLRKRFGLLSEFPRSFSLQSSQVV